VIFFDDAFDDSALFLFFELGPAPLQIRRLRKHFFSGKLAAAQGDALCNPTEDHLPEELLKHTMTEYNLSARAYDRILKVARTIADLAGRSQIASDDISEAIQYRSLDRQLWG